MGRRVCVSVCDVARVWASTCQHVSGSVYVFVCMCAFACMRGRIRLCSRVCVGACLCADVFVRSRVCMRVCVSVSVYGYVCVTVYV